MPRLDNQTLRERVYRHLKEEIMAGRIAPATVLQEVPLAESLGVSRGPIREALGTLAAEGLLTLTPRHGAVVTTLTKDDFLEAYQVREALEALAVRLAIPRMTDAEMEALDAYIVEMRRCAARSDDAGFFDANTAFHEAFVIGSGNGRLLEIYRRLIGQMRPYRRPSALLRGNLGQSIAEHQGIMDAARARDPERTARLTLDHIRVPQWRLQGLSDEEFAAENLQPPFPGQAPGVAPDRVGPEPARPSP
jgi:DNA-binding GntR family transcriptional regulator